MNGWKEVLSVFAVTISVGLLIGMLLLINSTKKIDKSQQEIRQEKITKAQSQQSSEARSKASSTKVEVPEAETTYDTTEETEPAVENTGEYEIVGDPIDYTDAPGPQAPAWYYECDAKTIRHNILSVFNQTNQRMKGQSIVVHLSVIQTIFTKILRIYSISHQKKKHIFLHCKDLIGKVVVIKVVKRRTM